MIDSEDIMLLDRFDNFQPEDPHNLKSANPSKLALYQDPMLEYLTDSSKEKDSKNIIMSL